jgi:Domain of unknown function (DUF1707)
MTGPRDETTAGAAAGRGRMRASQADREQTIEVLKIAFVQGRLDPGELDARAGQAFTARTYAELAALTADIPAAPAAVRPPRQPAPARARKRTIQKAVACGVFAVLMACLIAVLAAFGNGKLMEGAGILFAISAATLGGPLILYSWLDKRAVRPQPPAGPFPGGTGREGRHRAVMPDDQALPGIHPDGPDTDLRALRSRPHRPDPSRRGIQASPHVRPAPGPA